MKKVLFTSALLAMLPLGVSAHHGTNGQFDASKLVSVSGTISRLAFVNPHAYVYINVTDEAGNTEEWNCELRASSVMKRSGWTADMFVVGDWVDIEGVAARRDPLGCYMETISFNGGTPIERYAIIEEQQLEPEVERPATTPWGVPYIGGDWAADQRLVGAISGPNAVAGPPGAGGGRRGGASVAFTEAGQAALDAITAATAGDNIEGRLDCKPRDFFSDWTFDQPANRIVQQRDKITLRYGFMDTNRVVHMNMAEHPADIEPSWAGHSIGRWEDNVLVVDTVGFTEDEYRNTVHSEQYHTVERFYLEEQDDGRLGLVRSYVADDALYWEEGSTLSGQQVVYLADYPYEPYACDDRSVE